MDANTVLIMAGGTGGHVFPGLAIAEELAARGIHTEWLGTAAGIESKLVPDRKILLHCIPVRGIRGKGLKQIIMSPFNIVRAVVSAMRVIKKVKPKLVLGFGGYASGPGGLAAKISGIPLIIHEQNAVAGTTNRLLSKIAKKVFMAFPCGLKNGVCIGNPVRTAIEAIAEPETRMSKRDGKINILVLGGSRGAKAINDLVPAALAKVDHNIFNVWHQTGVGKDLETRVAYEPIKDRVRVEEFISDVAEAYTWADIAICRAGALTVSEVAAVGLASIFIPFPYAIDNHQTQNARFLQEVGAAVIKQQNELDVNVLKEMLTNILSDRSELLVMAKKARAMAKPEAAKKVADYCEELLYGAS